MNIHQLPMDSFYFAARRLCSKIRTETPKAGFAQKPLTAVSGSLIPTYSSQHKPFKSHQPRLVDRSFQPEKAAIERSIN
jgi:hypothetical protein